jgi:hypothetical protein
MTLGFTSIAVLLLNAVARTVADIAPEITTVVEGYNYIAKLPCIDCPYLYQDTSAGENGPWTSRIDNNALLLNISLPFDATYLSLNNGPLLTPSSVLPRIYASQVLSDYSTADLSASISNEALDTAGPLLGLSYGYSVRPVTNSSALVFRFNIFEAYFPLASPPITIKLDDHKQRVIELILFQRPLYSPGDVGPAWEIVTVRLEERDKMGSKRRMRTMEFLDWDEFGRKGSPAHLASTTSDWFVRHISSGFWSLSMFILGALVLFVVICVAAVLGWDWYSGDYEKAQSRKGRSRSGGSGGWTGTDVEKAKGRFLSASELGMRGTGNVVGIGKSD